MKTIPDIILEHYNDNKNYIREIGWDTNDIPSIITEDEEELMKILGNIIVEHNINVYNHDEAAKCGECLTITDIEEISIDADSGIHLCGKCHHTE